MSSNSFRDAVAMQAAAALASAAAHSDGIPMVITPNMDDLRPTRPPLPKVPQTRLVPGADVGMMAAAAANAVADAGGSPRAQLEAARKHAGRRLVYKPHQGARERARRIAQMQKSGELPADES